MKIIPAEVKHAEYIGSELANFFSQANIHFGYPKYKEDYQLMYKHVTKRLKQSDPSSFYFVQIEDDKELGFVNLMIDENRIGNINIIIGESDEIIKSLFDYAIEFFKNSKIEKVQIEVLPNEKILETFMKNLNSEIVLKRYKITLVE
jgi:hypothetical protein